MFQYKFYVSDNYVSENYARLRADIFVAYCYRYA